MKLDITYILEFEHEINEPECWARGTYRKSSEFFTINSSFFIYQVVSFSFYITSLLSDLLPFYSVHFEDKSMCKKTGSPEVNPFPIDFIVVAHFINE